MLHFEENWFRDEEREGFLVKEEVKRGWAAQLVIVKEIEEVCRKYGLTYYTAWGTTLGAVRHTGKNDYLLTAEESVALAGITEEFMRLRKERQGN